MAKRVLIAGASVAGPALAFWLGRSGYEVTVVERSNRLREGGHAVDFRGPAHFMVLERMGVLDELRELQTHGGAMRFIDRRERTRLSLPREFAGGDLEVRRGDLARVLYERSRPHAEYVFGDRVETLTQDGTGVDVTFQRAPPRRFDLVFGADGIHSRTRRLLFGKSFETYLGYRVAGWDASQLHTSGDETVLLNAPGRMIGLTPVNRSGGAPRIFCIFASPEKDTSRDPEEHKVQLREIFGDLGWRMPEILESLDRADDVFVSSLNRAEPPHWSAGRVALVGDAASGVAIGGMGTGMALIGAYVLAGELSLDPNDPSEAFARYQQRLEPHVRAVTRSASPGPFLAPRTALGLWLRNALFSVPACQRWLVRESRRRTEVGFPDYPNLLSLASPTQTRATTAVQ